MNLKEITLLQKIGQGANGVCYLVSNKKNGQIMIMKKIEIQKMSEQEKVYVREEIKIMKSLTHPNIINFIAFEVTFSKVYIFMEYAENGSLNDAMKANPVFSEQQILRWTFQILNALKYLHDNNILHRDIKPENILLDKNNQIKIADFGISKISHSYATTFCGTPYYISPEIINQMPYSVKTDIWSLGVVIYELCTRRMPFEADSLSLLSYLITKGKFKSMKGFSKEIEALVRKMLIVNPSKRYDDNQLLKDVIFNTINKENISDKIFIKSKKVTKKKPLVKNIEQIVHSPKNKVNKQQERNELNDLMDLCDKIDEEKGVESDEVDINRSNQIYDLKTELHLDKKSLKEMQISIVHKIGENKFKEITENFTNRLKAFKNLSEIDVEKKQIAKDFNIHLDQALDIIDLILQKQIVKNSEEFTQVYCQLIYYYLLLQLMTV